MRLRLLVLLAWLVVPVAAFAKPTLAVAPIDGDKGGKIAKAVTEAAEEDAKVIGPAKVEATMEKLSIKEIDGRAVKKLRKKLDAEVIVYGAVEGKKLELKVSARGKKTQTIEIKFKTVDAKFKKQLAKELGKQLSSDERDDANNDDDEEEEQARRAKEKERQREREEREKDARKKKDDDDDKERKKRTAKKKDDDDDDDRSRKRRRRNDEDEDQDRPTTRYLTTQAAIRVDAGAVIARRSLTYGYAQQGLANYPPGVGTFGPAARVDAEIYPGSFETLKGPAANVGLVASFEKTFAVGIDVPGSALEATVDQAKYEVGARYRVPFGTSAVAFGASYWHRHYKISREAQLDAPDVSYAAVSPNVMVRVGASKELAVFFNVAAQLMFSTGQIQEDTSFGPADVVAFEAEGGFDYVVSKNLAVHVAAEFGQVGLKFKQKAGTMSASRGVGSATDRVIGASASLSILY